MKITIEGVQGCGKTRLANEIIGLLEARSERVRFIEGTEGYVAYKTPRCRKFDVEIITKQST